MVCIISSAGGHLAEAMKSCSLLTNSGYSFFYVTARVGHIAETLAAYEHYFVIDPHTSSLKYIINFFQCLKLYIKKRPKIILTTGAGIAIPMCIIGKLFGSKIVVIESGCRVSQPSRTSKFLYPLADLFIVQWPQLLKCFPKAIMGGALI